MEETEETLEKGRLPQMDSIEDLARFWDTHDLTDFEEDLEELRQPVFVRAKGTALTVSLKASKAQRLKRIASSKGLKDTALLRQWIVERLHDVSGLDRRHKPMQPPRSAAKPHRVPSAHKKREPRRG